MRSGAARVRIKKFRPLGNAGARVAGKAVFAPGRRMRHAINAPDQWG
jgi:hypothetical protein